MKSVKMELDIDKNKFRFVLADEMNHFSDQGYDFFEYYLAGRTTTV